MQILKKLNLLPDPKQFSDTARARILKSSALTVLLLYFTGTSVLWFFVFAREQDLMLISITILCMSLGQIIEIFIHDRNALASSRIDTLDPSIRIAFTFLYHGGIVGLL